MGDQFARGSCSAAKEKSSTKSTGAFGSGIAIFSGVRFVVFDATKPGEVGDVFISVDSRAGGPLVFPECAS